LYWYRRAYRHMGDFSAANNIGVIWRDRGNLGRALQWFQKAVEAGDGDANLEIAKVYLGKGQADKAIPYLAQTCKSPWATDLSKEEARQLLRATR